MLLVGFGHKARQGKNTAALAFLERCPLDSRARIFAYGDALKLEVRKASYAMGGQFQLIESFKEAGLMPDWVRVEDGKARSLLQWWGTDYRRAQDKDYWIKRLAKKLAEYAPEVALITDVRFWNEAEYIHSNGGYLVKVTRTTKPDILVHPHPSECALDDYTAWDYEIKAATIPELKDKARALYREIAGRHGISL